MSFVLFVVIQVFQLEEWNFFGGGENILLNWVPKSVFSIINLLELFICKISS